MNLEIQPLNTAYLPWAVTLWRRHFASTRVVSRGRLYDARTLSGFVALLDGQPVGVATWRFENDECELVTIDSVIEGIGAGTILIEAVRRTAESAGCSRLWLVTTNDNTPALRFYQRRGFQLVALHRNALDVSRQLKPEIPLVGLNGIPLRDEIELEILLSGA